MQRRTRHIASSAALAALLALPAPAQELRSFYPDEDVPHEGTWLQWPHRYTYGLPYQQQLDPTWTAMTAALVQSENVHIIAYDGAEVTRIQSLLTGAGVSLDRVDFLIRATDDTWVRDNGPIFVYGPGGDLRIVDWGFNGWGLDAPFALDDTVPTFVAGALGVPAIDASEVVLEGGAIEVDGSGTLLATRSSILDPKRNPGLSQADVEEAMTRHLGVVNFVWLDGTFGGWWDITDTHIDGVARFSGQTIVTMDPPDLVYYGLTPGDVGTLYGATNAVGEPFSYLPLPLTAGNVVTTYGLNLGSKGSYVNYYAGNSVVLMPTYADPNDSVALALLQQQYPDRTVVGIDCRNLYRYGGMVHCVTQQQPVVPGGVGTVVGQGCPSPPLEVETYVPPTVGKTLVLGIHGLPAGTSAALLLGGTAVDVPLDAFGLTGCSLYTTAAVTAAAPFAGVDGYALVPLADDAGLVGASFRVQIGAVAPGATPAGLVTSNGLTLTVAP
ncbi:MAG: agmatine deiminase family protein [Planctomycetota bacterium]